jgi:hypothetical protein
MSNDRMNLCAALFSPLLVAAVMVTGLASLSAQNLSGSGVMRQAQQDHATAIQKLLFRH